MKKHAETNSRNKPENFKFIKNLIKHIDYRRHVMMITLAIIVVAAVLVLGHFQTAISGLGLTGVANSTAYQAIANTYTGLAVSHDRHNSPSGA